MMLLQIKVKRCLGGWGELGVADMLAACETTSRMAQLGGGEELREGTEQEPSELEMGEAGWRGCVRESCDSQAGESAPQHLRDSATRSTRRMNRASLGS